MKLYISCIYKYETDWNRCNCQTLMWIIASVESRTGKGEKNLDTWTPECILCALASCCALPLTILRLAHLDHSVTPRTRSWHIYIYNSKDRVLDYIYICNSKDKVLVYIYIYNSKDRVLDYICLVFKKKTSLFRTLPVRQTSYCFMHVMVLAMVFIFKDKVLVYICN